MLQNLPLELVETVLDYLDDHDLLNTLRTARFLRHPSERKLYREISLSAHASKGCFPETIVDDDRLAGYVTRVVTGDAGDQRFNAVVGQAMKKMINLKDLDIYGDSSSITNLRLDLVPFSLTRFVLTILGWGDDSEFLPFVSILRAHPNIEELAFDFSSPPLDLIAVLKAEEETPGSDILCPRLNSFYGNVEDLRLFLPRRRINRVRAIGSETDRLVDQRDLATLWLTPSLIPSYQHLRILEVGLFDPRTRNTCFLLIIAPYLISLTHLLLSDRSSRYHPADDILLSLRGLRALESFTLTDLDGAAVLDVPNPHAIVDLVRTVFPDIAEIFVGGCNSRYYQYKKGRRLHSSLVSEEVACRPYTKPYCARARDL